MEHPLVCVMPLDHPLAANSVIEPQDLDRLPFVSFNPDTYIDHLVEGVFETYKVRPEIVLVANVAPTLCEFVAAGLGVSLSIRLWRAALEHRLAVRRFEPDIPFHFQLGHNVNSRNYQIVGAFAEELRATATQISSSMLG